MPRRRSPLVPTVLGALLTFAAAPAEAAPQLGAELTTGVALTDLRAANAPRVAYHLGARFDVLFLRDRAETMGLGPYVEVATAAFDTLESGGGLSWLLPIDDTALILSAGAFARTSRFGWEPGAAGTVFWGSRSYNYHGLYAVGLGLFLQGRYGLGEGRQADAVGGVQVDLAYLALPFLLAYEAVAR